MNMLASQVKEFSDRLLPRIPSFSNWCSTVICAPYALLHSAVEAFVNSGVYIGAQNMSWHESGAFTGEVSAAQLVDLGVKHVIIGHSERRELYGETDASVNKKVIAALDRNLCPILCVGESLIQREIGVTNDLVSMQVKAALHGVGEQNLSRVIVAYEPIWAIGTGLTATPEDAQNVCAMIRSVLSSLYSDKTAQAITIQYGGSMNENNASALLAQPDIDGGLIGGASLKPDTFAAIVNAANQ